MVIIQHWRTRDIIHHAVMCAPFKCRITLVCGCTLRVFIGLSEFSCFLRKVDVILHHVNI